MKFINVVVSLLAVVGGILTCVLNSFTYKDPILFVLGGIIIIFGSLFFAFEISGGSYEN